MKYILRQFDFRASLGAPHNNFPHPTPIEKPAFFHDMQIIENFRINQKVILFVISGNLSLQSPEMRVFVNDMLGNLSEQIYFVNEVAPLPEISLELTLIYNKNWK